MPTLTQRCSPEGLSLIDYGLEASVPFDINAVSNVDKLLEKLGCTRRGLYFSKGRVSAF